MLPRSTGGTQDGRRVDMPKSMEVGWDVGVTFFGVALGEAMDGVSIPGSGTLRDMRGGAIFGFAILASVALS